jgi:phage tail sheath protein FI
MTRPGVVVRLSQAPGQVAIASDTGKWFASGLTERGPVAPTPIKSLNQFVQTFGDRQTYSVLYDAVELFFREGGETVVISRIVGPAATTGFKNLLDAGAAISLIATAIGPGAWSANYKVAVLTGTVAGTFVIQVTDASNVVLEDSGNLATQQDAVAWSQGSLYIRLTLGASALDPAPLAATVLSTGNDDRGAVTDTQWNTALGLLTNDFGVGQVSQPGRSTSTAYSQMITHATDFNRVAILDLPDSGNSATLISAVSTINARNVAAFGPWITVPGLVVATTRVVPPCALVAGLIARNDPGFGPNRPAAGNAGISNFAIGVSQTQFPDPTRESLNSEGCNIIRYMQGAVKVYGWRSLADPINDQQWIAFGNSRLYMGLVSELNQVGENYMFDEIDGVDGITITTFHGDLVSVLLSHYAAGELFGTNAEDAFSVDTSPAVNTPTTIARLELHAIVSVRMAPFAEMVVIDVVKQRIT